MSKSIKDLRVLMVCAPYPGSADPAAWARHQTDSLKALGVAVDTYIFENRRSLRGLLEGGLALRRMAREFRADLVHVHYGAAQALIAVLFSPQPVVISFCGSDLLGNYDAGARKTHSGRLSAVLSQVAAIGARRCIAKTERLKQAQWLPSCRSKCEIIPNGVNLTQFFPVSQTEARASLGWHHNDPVVLFMDRKGAWVKDPGLAHAAYREARRIVPSLRFHIVETEPHHKMPLFYNAADVLLLTSRHEGSNNTVKEAMACNLPVVATACGDIPERILGVKQSYVCSRDPAEIGACVAQVVTVRDRSNGRNHVLELALDRTALRVTECYQKALSYR